MRTADPESLPPEQFRRVLMVDDNPTNLQVLSQALQDQQYELLVALSGDEALEIAAEARPALILLDINMPGLDGFETCRRLKADPATREIVVMFLSARGSVQDKVEGLKLGAVDLMEAMSRITDEEGSPVRLRVGIHSGPVVAGVIGEKKFAYDLWGDTVNTASRMEESGEADRIQISAATRDLLGDEFACEARGGVAVKGKGTMETYFLTGRAG